MPRPNRIPLFPLDVVLMPGVRLPLPIFEPRYKTMIAKCLAEKLEFGMILAAGQSIAAVGCTAEIAEKIRDYPDGRMDIVAVGRVAFHLAELLDEKEYYEGVVEYLTDEPSPADEVQESQLLDAFDKCHVLLFDSPWPNAALSEPETMAYRMAALVPMELEKRQALLETRSPHERREILLRWLERFVPKLAAQQRMQKRAGGNGHSVN